MKNFVQEGKIVSFVAAAALSAGVGVLTGNLFGVVAGDVASGDTGEMVVEGVFDLAKAAVAITDRDLIYWDDTNGVVTNVSTGNRLIGTAMADAANGDATARVRLRGAEDEHMGGVGAAVADLTENAGAIGGTNDGDLPDLTATTNAITDNTGGTASTTELANLADGTTYATDHAAIENNFATLGAENAALKTDLAAAVAAVRELAADNNALKAQLRAAGVIASS